jgi:hypothetical protein
MAELGVLEDDAPDVVPAVFCDGSTSEVRIWATAFARSIPIIADPGGRTATRLVVGLYPFVVAVDVNGMAQFSGIVDDYASVLRILDPTNELVVARHQFG